MFGAKRQWLIFWFPLVFFVVAALLCVTSPKTYKLLFGVLEAGLCEWVQFACYVCAAVMGGMSVRALRGVAGPVKASRVILVLFSIGCIFIAGEEASWGQHVFGWATPVEMAKLNMQQETNIHNLVAVQGNRLHVVAFVSVSLAGFVGCLFRRKVEHGVRDLILVEKVAAPYFFLVFLFYFQMWWTRGGAEHQEVFETLLACGFVVVAWMNLKKVKVLHVLQTSHGGVHAAATQWSPMQR